MRFYSMGLIIVSMKITHDRALKAGYLTKFIIYGVVKWNNLD